MKSETTEIPRGTEVPRHIAIIMDGNGRWAKTHRLGRISGHRRGATTVRNIVTACRELGVEVLTLYAFSEENWKRPKAEVSALMLFLRKFLISERGLLTKREIRLRTIGDISKLPPGVRRTLDETMAITEKFEEMTLVLALSYGGREEIARAVRKIARDAADGNISPEEITAETISGRLDTAGFPDPDLMIRTSGEFRTSNFLPWQSIYTEFHITPTLWPDFTKEDLHKAIFDYARRERRFGMTSEQLPQRKAAGAGRWHHAK